MSRDDFPASDLDAPVMWVLDGVRVNAETARQSFEIGFRVFVRALPSIRRPNDKSTMIYEVLNESIFDFDDAEFLVCNALNDERSRDWLQTRRSK